MSLNFSSGHFLSHKILKYNDMKYEHKINLLKSLILSLYFLMIGIVLKNNIIKIIMCHKIKDIRETIQPSI